MQLLDSNADCGDIYEAHHNINGFPPIPSCTLIYSLYISYLPLLDKLPSQFSVLKQHALSRGFWGSWCGSSLPRGSVSDSLMKLQLSCQLGMQCSEALTGTGRSTSKKFSPPLPRVLAKALFPHHMDHSTELSTIFQDMAVDFLQNDVW